MANSAPYEVNVTGTDDETFQFVIPFEKSDGTAFPFNEYAIEYSVTRCGSQVLMLTEGGGIEVQAPDVFFKAAQGALSVGEYQHGCRIRHRGTGDIMQVFDGSITIGQGGF